VFGIMSKHSTYKTETLVTRRTISNSLDNCKWLGVKNALQGVECVRSDLLSPIIVGVDIGTMLYLVGISPDHMYNFLWYGFDTMVLTSFTLSTVHLIPGCQVPCAPILSECRVIYGLSKLLPHTQVYTG